VCVGGLGRIPEREREREREESVGNPHVTEKVNKERLTGGAGVYLYSIKVTCFGVYLYSFNGTCFGVPARMGPQSQPRTVTVATTDNNREHG